MGGSLTASNRGLFKTLGKRGRSGTFATSQSGVQGEPQTIIELFGVVMPFRASTALGALGNPGDLGASREDALRRPQRPL